MVDKTSPIFDRFPSRDSDTSLKDTKNAAIQLYGRRYYKDQTTVEYLSEFLLVFASAKNSDGYGEYQFKLNNLNGPFFYYPKNRISLKMFAFFPSSKLETRHPIHQKTYLEMIGKIQAGIEGNIGEKSEALRLIQSLFEGFVGVSKNRTWVTHSFLPASPGLLARELEWLHSKALKDTRLEKWNDAKKHFATDRHNFMARGGEVLFLQLANLFSNENEKLIKEITGNQNYKHLSGISLQRLRESLEKELQSMLEETSGELTKFIEFVENSLENFEFENFPEKASLGWVPRLSVYEAFLFASELENICRSNLSPLEKINLLEIHCSMHVLRSLCFQAKRFIKERNDTVSIDEFIGGYSWIPANLSAVNTKSIKKLAQRSFEDIEEMLYRVIKEMKILQKENGSELEAEKHGFQIFRKIAKEIGLVIPPKGQGQRFVLPPSILRFLVASLIPPGERIRLTEFYKRTFAHYGIALGERQLAIALAWKEKNGNTKENGIAKEYAIMADTSWVEEALKQGGFLVELSDAVSIVHNPGRKEQLA